MLSFEDFNLFCTKNTNFLADKTIYDFSNTITTNFKQDGSVVTNTDFYIEDQIRNSIKANFPEHGIWGEEREPVNPNSSFKWVIDPIDGTFGYSRGVPLWGSLVGLLLDDNPIYGYLRLPILGNIWISGDNHVACLNGVPLKSHKIESRKNILALTTDISTIEASPVNDIWQKAIKLGAITRTWGDCFGYFLVCTGKADLMADTGLKPFDILPLLPIILGTGLNVEQFDCSDYSNIAVTNSYMLELLS